MLLNEIREQVKEGRLKLVKRDCGFRYRRLPIYSKTKGEWIEYPEMKKGEIKMVKKWMGDYEDFRTIKYPHITYRAMIDEHKGYNISKKVYEELSTLDL